MPRNTIYLADLTHDGPILSSNVFPLSIGLSSAYLLKNRRADVSVELFKYPKDLSHALETAPPPIIVGFANYSWNFSLSLAYARRIKKFWPSTTIVFGGPNYGLTPEEMNEFWQTCGDAVDFSVVKEGEESFLRLYDALAARAFQADRVKSARLEIGNIHYPVDSEIITGPDLPRIEISSIPSPYTMGLMDKFFDHKLSPLVHTTRGCPFRCAFCTEGSSYFNLVKQRVDDFEEEMRYISPRIKGPKDLFISDANFGMFKQDQTKANVLAKCQSEFGYPKNIYVSTGKNQKERVIKIIQSLNGAVSMAASLQSTNETVLQNVARSNISVEKLAAAGKMASASEAGTYSEIILGIPGDSLDAHRQSLNDAVELGFDNIRMYQFILLPQTVLNTPEQRQKYDMKSLFRIVPRSFGKYTLAGEEFVACEFEEILVSHSTLSFEDYAKCREMDLTIEILHNGGIFNEVAGACDAFGLSWFQLMMEFYERRREFGPAIAAMYDEFIDGMTKFTWPSKTALAEYVERNIDAMLSDESGTNEMSKGKATAFFLNFKEINAALFQLLEEAICATRRLDDDTRFFIKDLERYSYLRKSELFSNPGQIVESFSIDLPEIERQKFRVPPGQAMLSERRLFSISHDAEQADRIGEFRDTYSHSIDGLGRLLMRYPYINRLFRRPEPVA